MRSFIFTLACAASVFLAGCATTAPSTGNHITTAVDQQTLANEAVKQIVALWPPAKTQLDFKQPTPDPFGVALVAGLRERGYALMEYSQTPENAPQSAPATTALPLTYVLDESGTPAFFRVTLTVGGQSITRPYIDQDGKVQPVGYWVRKE